MHIKFSRVKIYSLGHFDTQIPKRVASSPSAALCQSVSVCSGPLNWIYNCMHQNRVSTDGDSLGTYLDYTSWNWNWDWDCAIVDRSARSGMRMCIRADTCATGSVTVRSVCGKQPTAVCEVQLNRTVSRRQLPHLNYGPCMDLR